MNGSPSAGAPTPGFRSLAIKTMVVHTITYFVMGMIASNLLNYAELFAGPGYAGYMRQLDDPVIAIGPLAQPVRGLVFALVFYPLREIFFERRSGWLILWWTLVGLGILSPFGPVGIEGLIFTQVPIPVQLLGLLEVVPQAFLLSAILTYWIHHPEKRWLSWVLGILVVIMLLMPALALAMMLAAQGS